MSNPIPTRSRERVEARDRGYCQRCGAKAPVQWHHRRSRRVSGEHQHCAGNGISLCAACHGWAHAHPDDARRDGLIVSAFVETPDDVPVRTFAGWRTHIHDGSYTWTADPTKEPTA